MLPSASLAAAAAITPEPVLALIRTLMRDNCALRLDTADRTAYRSRIDGH